MPAHHHTGRCDDELQPLEAQLLGKGGEGLSAFIHQTSPSLVSVSGSLYFPAIND